MLAPETRLFCTFPRKYVLKRIVVTATIFEAGLLVLAVGVGWYLAAPPFRQFQIRLHVLLWGFLATIPPILVLLWCSHSKWGPLVRIVSEVERDILPTFSNCSLFDFALISIVAGVSEEALFRGGIQQWLSGPLSPWGAMVFAGILFGLLHLITPAYAVLGAGIGIYLGWLMVVSENLLLPIEVHVLYDFLALTYAVSRYRARSS